MARWTLIIGVVSTGALILSAFGVFLIYVTFGQTRRAARSAEHTYKAFVAVEDANIVVEFPDGNLVETFVEGVKQPDTYIFDVNITNIGRSTARIHGWETEGGKPERHEQTLKANATWAAGDQIQVVPEDGYFSLSIHYSSSLHERMVRVVKARVKATPRPNGPTHYAGLVKSTQLRKRDS